MNDFIRITNISNQTEYIRRSAVIRFSYSEEADITTIVVSSTNDQDNHVWAKGDLTLEILGVEE